jgi:Fe-S-cluster containining protein
MVGAAKSGFPFRFECQRSGNCCSIPGGVVRVSDAEAVAIAGYLGMTESGFRSRYLAVGGDRLVEGIGPRCVFLAAGGAEGRGESGTERSGENGAESSGDSGAGGSGENGTESSGDRGSNSTTTASCSIYPVRPLKCRTWPFWEELRDNPDGLRRAADLCPGIRLPSTGDGDRVAE